MRPAFSQRPPSVFSKKRTRVVRERSDEQDKERHNPKDELLPFPTRRLGTDGVRRTFLVWRTPIGQIECPTEQTCRGRQEIGSVGLELQHDGSASETQYGKHERAQAADGRSNRRANGAAVEELHVVLHGITIRTPVRRVPAQWPPRTFALTSSP